MEFVKSGINPFAKQRLSKEILNAVDIKVAQSLISIHNESSLMYFNDNYFSPFFQREHRKKNLFDKMISIEEGGMLYQLLLNEYEQVASQYSNFPSDDDLVKESIDFFDFITKLATRRRGEKGDLLFIKNYFRIGVIFAINDYYINYEFNEKITNYTNRIQNYIDAGVEKIYVYALGRKVEYARLIANVAKSINASIIEVNFIEYKRENLERKKMINGICIELYVSQK